MIIQYSKSLSINYTLKAKRQSLVSLRPALIKYYYLHEIECTSNSVLIKIISPKIRQYSYIALPVLITLGFTFIYLWQIRKYKKRKIAFQRSEMAILGLDSRDTVLKVEHTLRERFHILSENSKANSFDYEPIDKSANKNGHG